MFQIPQIDNKNNIIVISDVLFHTYNSNIIIFKLYRGTEEIILVSGMM